MTSTIRLSVVNRELDGRTMDEARSLVTQGEARWVRGSLATLKIVPPSYTLEEDELFVHEVWGEFAPV